MVEVPTFQSQAVTRTSDLGVVSFSGQRNMGQAFQSVGALFDQLGDFQNRKANEAMERNMKRQGQEVARMKGFDPNELKEPVTAADQLYRESALQTYAIGLESDVSKTMDRLFLQNLNNPEGFRRSAESYSKKAIDSVPWELKNGVSKMATAETNSKYSQLALNYQKRVLAETEVAEKAYQEDLISKVALAQNPEEKQALMAKVESSVVNSSTYLTPMGKQQRVRELQNEAIFQDELLGVHNGDKTPFEVLQNMQELGIAPNSQQVNQIYSAAGQRMNYENAMINQREGARVARIESAADQLLTELHQYKGQPNGQVAFDMISKSGATILLKSGAKAEEVVKFQETANKLFYNDNKDNTFVKSMLDDAVYNLDPEANNKIAKAFADGAITLETKTEMLQRNTTERASVRSNPVLKSFIENVVIPNYAPYARRAVPGYESVYGMSEKKPIIDEHKQFIDNTIDQAVVLNKSISMDEVVRQIEADLRANAQPMPAKQRAALSSGTKHQSRIAEMYSQPNFTLDAITAKGRRLYTFESAPDNIKEVLKGPWTNDNAKARLKLMIQQNIAAEKMGLTKPYPDEMLKEVKSQW